MDKLKILSGNACFLVQNTSQTMSRKQFEDYLKKEGFEEFRKYGWKDRGCFYINVNSLRYAAGVPKPVKLTGTLVGESKKKCIHNRGVQNNLEYIENSYWRVKIN